MGVPWWVWPQSVLLVLVHVYLWWRLVRAPLRPGRLRRLATIGLAVLAFAPMAALVAMHTLPPDAGVWLTWPGFVWYALVVYLLLTLLLGELLRLVLAVTRRLRRGEPSSPVPASGGGRRSNRDDSVAEPDAELSGSRTASPGDDTATGVDLSRRRFLARGIAASAAVVATATVGYGLATALSTPALERVTIRLPRLNPAADGYRIGMIVDTHLGPFLGRDSMRRVVEIVNDAECDLVVIPGDLIDGTVTDLREAVAPLAELRGRDGVYFSTGNHEYLFDADAWVDHLSGLGIRTLRNERLRLAHFDLAGVNDTTGELTGDAPDFARALDGRDTDRPVLLLAHQPAQAYQAETFGVDLQLSGHTHGGQFFPAGLLTSIGQPVMSGHTRLGDTQLYVSRGAGFWGPAVRVASPPEVTLIELAAG